MTDTTSTAAPRDHNRPPSTFDDVKARLGRDYGHIPSRARALIGAAKSLDEEIANEQDEKLLTDQGTQIRDTVAEWEKMRKAEKEPYLEGGRAVDEFFGENTKPLSAALDSLRKRLAVWKQKKVDAELARRKAEEEKLRLDAEKAKAEAEAAAASIQNEVDLEKAVSAEEYARAILEDAQLAAQAAQGSVDTLTHGEYGGRSSGQQRWKCLEWDRATVDLNQLRPHFTDEAIEKAIAAYIRNGGRILRGAKIDLVMTTRF